MAKAILAIAVPKGKGGALSEKETAAQDLIDAVKSGDAKGAALAFATMYELCAAKAEEEAEGEEY